MCLHSSHVKSIILTYIHKYVYLIYILHFLNSNIYLFIFFLLLLRPVLMQYSEAEGELSLSAGDYILVWGSGEPQGGYFDAELLDGRRGLVPASFVQRLIG